MTAAAAPAKDGSPLSSSASFETSQWPLRDNLALPSYDADPDADADQGNDGLGRALDENARGLSTGPGERQQPASPSPAAAVAAAAAGDRARAKARPWWKTRKALMAYAVAAVLLVVFVVLLVLGLEGYLRKPASNPTIHLGYATYEGTTVAGGINRFLGMRYAAAPVGDLRWRAPAPPPNSTDTQPAKDFGPICLGISVAYPSATESEDCLFANVWAPAGANATSKLPVWLFIQGGGYTANANANWDGAEVVKTSGNQIVFVNFNYRVALWGFLASSRVATNGSLNAGLLDQRFLMQWVHDYIALFGGDPDNVTIHGASAGAGSVALHLTAFGGRNDGLFAAAIAESVFFPAQPFVAQLEYQFDRLSNATGCAGARGDDDDDELACLRQLDTATLQAQNVPSPFPGRTASPVPLFYWTPCIDGDFLHDLPYAMFASGRFVNVPLLWGNDNDEGSEFATNAATSDDMLNFFQNNYPLLNANDTDAIVALYPLQTTAIAQHAAWFPSASLAYGEATFICPAINVFDAYLSLANNDTADGHVQLWNYRYNVLDANNAAAGLGVPHLWESFAVFGPANLAGAPAPTSYLTYDASMVPLVMGYFLSFVQTHDPNTLRVEGSPAWESWGNTSAVGGGSSSSSGSSTTNMPSRIVLETNNTRMESVEVEQMARCKFWAGIAPETQQKKMRRDGERWEGHHVYGHEI